MPSRSTPRQRTDCVGWAVLDWGLVEEAIWANSPSRIALHGADYLDFRNKSVDRYDDLTLDSRAFVEDVEQRTGIPVSFIGTGPTNEEIIDRRKPSFRPIPPAAIYSTA